MADMQHVSLEPDRPGTMRMRVTRLLGHDAVVGCGALLATLTVLTLVVPPAWMTAPRGDQAGLAAPRAGAEIYLLARHGEERSVDRIVRERLRGDIEALERFRPGYRFWQHVFALPDGSVIFGDASDGRLLASFPSRGDWDAGARWEDPSLAPILWNRRLATDGARRRDQIAELLQGPGGPALHNATRGDFVLRNVPRYGGFLEEWGRIYERFGVPAEIGLAQAMVESGLNGTIRSEAGAVGLCQWLRGNWNRMNQLSSHEIEGHNQTTQAPYCAAYLTVLATRYGSFIPALSEHHAGGTNVGRTLINGGLLGAETPREQYLIGSELARDLRDLSRSRYRDVVRSYGPRSYLYAEMVFGNAANVDRIQNGVPQSPIHAMRAGSPISLAEVVGRTGLDPDEIRRFNPALIRRVPAGANLYLPFQVDDFGPDVAFWHRPAHPDFAAVLADFLGVDATVEEWENPAFGAVLDGYRRRFAATGTEEGDVMATVLAYAAEEAYLSRRPEILAEFRSDPRIRLLVLEGASARTRSGSSTGATASVSVR
jgi:hypothetical protein